MSKREIRVVGLVVGLAILMSFVPSLVAKPSCETKIGTPATKERNLMYPPFYYPSMKPIIIVDMVTPPIIGRSDTEKMIRVSAEIIILRPSGKD